MRITYQEWLAPRRLRCTETCTCANSYTGNGWHVMLIHIYQEWLAREMLDMSADDGDDNLTELVRRV